MSFSSLGLSAELVRAVSEKGYTQATPIQIQAIPVILEGRDILAGAQTGTGKTAGFTLPLLQRLNATPQGARRAVRALILTPTRELAAQVEESVRTYGKHVSLKSTVIFGGVGIHPQIDTLRRGVDILVATPGRLLDHVSQRTVDLSHVEILVLDEADRMLDMGFIRDIRKILALLPKKRQNLLFSATFSDEIKQLADGLLNSPALIEVARQSVAAELVSQVYHPVDRVRKRELLAHLIHSQGWKQVLVFTRTKHGANRLADQLDDDGISTSAIHGNKSQSARTKALADFKKGEVRVLVATDIAARGLDIDQLPHVVNYELPNVPEDYVHRIGRTGRAGKEGQAVSLVCVDEHEYLRDIQRLLKREIPKAVVEGFEPNPSIRAEPISHGRGQRGGGRPQGQRQDGEHRRHQQPQRHTQGRGDDQRARPHARGERTHSDAQPRSAGQRSHSNPHARSAEQRQHAPHHARHTSEAHGNSHAPRGEVDGNRRTPEGISSHTQVRSSFDKSDKPARRTRTSAGKGTVRRSW
ncbi:RNA helicase [Sulfuricaulis limicola]|uniref:ATP-dependent RNA helicase RhlE n=1 Tax=Sulfuricaulis limicola TaxID=1620215 RepID=A0A1B4XFX7_9GAMM|nr:DEAD/DEAH box helicase [Sulfuricaulis limicola]BAV33718.1 RNA helicase [Sulfuricaulis limicola]